MRFFRIVNGVTLSDKVRSCQILKALNVQPLLHRKEIFQLQWVGHVSHRCWSGWRDWPCAGMAARVPHQILRYQR